MKPPVEFRAALAEAAKHLILAAAEASDEESFDVAEHCTVAIKQVTTAMRHWNIKRKQRRGH